MMPIMTEQVVKHENMSAPTVRVDRIKCGKGLITFGSPCHSVPLRNYAMKQN